MGAPFDFFFQEMTIKLKDYSWASTSTVPGRREGQALEERRQHSNSVEALRAKVSCSVKI